MENRYEGSLEESLIGNSAEFENNARLNREPVKRFQKPTSTSNECCSNGFGD